MKELLVVVISWNRPAFLQQTLDSLFAQLGRSDTDVFIVDNGSESPTTDIIRSDPRVTGYQLLETNHGINGALESVLPPDVRPVYRYVLISDADMLYLRPLHEAVAVLDALPNIGAVSFQHSPEHPVENEFYFGGMKWFTKSSERGCSLMLRAEDLERTRPLPVENPKDFDWWVVRDAPASLQRRGLSVAVFSGGARHLGWRQGDSTWQMIETPEFAENKEAI